MTHKNLVMLEEEGFAVNVDEGHSKEGCVLTVVHTQAGMNGEGAFSGGLSSSS